MRAHLDDAQTRDLAVAFGAPVAINANMRDGSLRQAVMEKGIPMLLYEAGEALRFDEAGHPYRIQGDLVGNAAHRHVAGDPCTVKKD